MHIVRYDIATVQKAGSHVLPIARITLHHLVVGLEAGHRDLLNRVGFVRGLGGRDNRCIGDEREVNTRVRYEVGLELVQIDVERAIETEGSGDGRYDYGLD